MVWWWWLFGMIFQWVFNFFAMSQTSQIWTMRKAVNKVKIFRQPCAWYLGYLENFKTNFICHKQNGT